MDYERIKKQANEILLSQSPEGTYIEYKTSSQQLDKILKTLCAYGNNYYDNDIQYIFIGIEEINDENDKAIPKLPIKGIAQGNIEKCKNEINSLRPFLYPNVAFELITNQLDGIYYILITVLRQTGGPFMVSEQSEKNKRFHLKAGRYVRIEADSRLARVDEEYDLLRKFSNFHYSSLTSPDASINDLNLDYINEFVSETSSREIMEGLSKKQMAKSLHLLDRNDPAEEKIKNFAVLMFANKPEDFIPYAYTELIVDMFGSKRKMESKYFNGPIWKQYNSVIDYINNNFLNTLILRENGEAINRRIANFPFTAVEELVANAIVHNNYENGKPIQIYISDTQINIVNYNKPLPPLRLQDLNERNFFNERDTENPEIRDMFKSLGIIESFGTGIGEAKKALKNNGSPSLFYKIFDTMDNVTSVVIPVSEEYRNVKSAKNSSTTPEIQSQTQDIKQKILGSSFSNPTKDNMLHLYEAIGSEVFGNSKVALILNCSETSATNYIKRLYEDLHVTAQVEGNGKGKYKFIV